MPLRGRMARFVEQLLLDPNLDQTQAAIAAGYSPRTATVQASQVMADPRVVAALALAKEQRRVRVQVEQDDVLRELIGLVRSNVQHFAVDELGNISLAPGAPETAWAAVASVKRQIRHISNGPDEDPDIEYTCEFRLWPKDRALDLAMKHLGISGVDRHEHTGKDGAPLMPVPSVIQVVLVKPGKRPRRLKSRPTS